MNSMIIVWSVAGLVVVAGVVVTVILLTKKKKKTCDPKKKPNCPQSCDGNGAYCNDGEWECRKGTVCPTTEWATTNCVPWDPKNPLVPVCNKSTDYKVQGQNPCPLSGQPDCPYSADGQGLVCTQTGWDCKPRTRCPPQSWIDSNPEAVTAWIKKALFPSGHCNPGFHPACNPPDNIVECWSN